MIVETSLWNKWDSLHFSIWTVYAITFFLVYTTWDELLLYFKNELEISGLDALDIWLSLYCLCASDLPAWFLGKH